ncbi:g7788 [Coccomyxa elongata]
MCFLSFTSFSSFHRLLPAEADARSSDLEAYTMAQHEVDRLWSELQRVEQEIKEQQARIEAAMKAHELPELIAVIGRERERLVEEKKDLRHQLSALQAQLASPSGENGSKRQRHEALSNFWRELPSATTDEASSIMDLPAIPAAGAAFLPQLKRLYVRDCYVQLTDMATDGTQEDRLITGTPGTGKSCWQLHLLQRLASLERTVVLDWANSRGRLLFCPEGAFLGSKSSFMEELGDPRNFYLVDGQLPEAAAACRIETCSPMQSKHWEFVKDGADERIMPPWTLQELEAALPLFPSVSLARMHELYRRWGGVVRWVLARANRAGNEGFLERGIASSKLDDLLLAVGRSDAAKGVSSRLVHYIPDEDLRLSHLAMASQYVSDRVCETLLENNERNLRNFLAASSGANELGVLRGNLFESYTHLMLRRGGRFDVRYLDTGEEDVVDLPLGSLHWFSEINEVANLPDNAHCRPRSKNYTSIDFVRQPDEVAQVTQNLEHAPLESARIRECFEVLRAATKDPPDAVNLTVVVPPEIYPRVKEIPLTSTLSAKKYPVRHRVMRMPLMRAGALALSSALFQ